MNLPPNVTEECSSYYRMLIEGIRKANEITRCAILSPTGAILWQEPLDEYNKRMEGIDDLRV